MLGRPRGKFFWIVVPISVILLAVGIMILATRPQATSITTTNSADSEQRQLYATLYDAAWRQDDGRDSTLVTATLLVPPTIAALGLDPARSSVEEQLWNTVKSLDAKTVPIILTFDSVTGFQSDDEITSGLRLQGSSGTSFKLASWLSLIPPNRTVNSSSTTSSQIGVALFSAEQDIGWDKIGTIQLTVTGIGATPVRSFSWVEPKLLFDI